MSQSSLAALSPLSQSVISNISNGKYSNKICTEKCLDFGQWYREYRSDPVAVRSRGNRYIKDSRLTFHPEHELPLMRQWYRLGKAPTLEKLEFYLRELNRGPVRQERPKVTILKLKNWWKNERQKEKRELQGGEKPPKPARPSRRSHLVRNFVDLDNGAHVSVHDESAHYFAIPAVHPAFR